MRAMILAAGLGSRLRPLTSHLPKPLVPIVNQPLLWHLITRVKAAGIEEIAFNLHYRGDQIRDWLGNGHQFGIEACYSEERELLGSAGGLRRVRDFFGREPALVIHGDILFDVDLAAVIQYHHSRSAQATLVLHPDYQRYDYGRIRVNAQGDIGQFVHLRFPAVTGPLIDTVFTGVQVLAPDVLDAIPDSSTGFLTTDVYPTLLSSSSQVCGYLMQGYWSDIGTPGRYWETNMDVINGRAGLALHLPHAEGGREVYARGRGVVHAPAVLPVTFDFPAGTIIGPAVVMGEGCTIAEQVWLRRTVVWPGVRIGRGASLVDSIVMNDAIIPEGAHLVGKIVSADAVYDL